jgi:DNA-binding response OmpR family regulator
MRLLVIEDDTLITNFLKKGLKQSGFAVDIAIDGQEGRFLAESEDYDLIILDLMLPDDDGLEICKNLREKGNSTPILMLTAKTGVEDRVMGLNVGADDYLTKPFSFPELTARIQALLRRSRQASSPILTAGDLELDPVSHEVKRKGKNIELSPKEFAILEYLLRHKNQVVTRTMILEHVWDYNFETFSNVVDVYITHLRKKIDGNSSQRLIQTIHGVGFKIKD